MNIEIQVESGKKCLTSVKETEFEKKHAKS